MPDAALQSVSRWCSYSVAYSPDGECLVSTHKDGLRLWDLGASRESVFIPHTDTRALRFARDRPGLFTAGAAGLRWWPISVKQEGESRRVTFGVPEQVSRQPPGEVKPTNRVVLAADGKAYLIDAQSRRVERRITTAAGVHNAALSPDGHQCATWGVGGSVVEVWNADDGTRLAALAAPHARPFFSGDGHWLVTASAEECVFWDRKSWARSRSISCDIGSMCLDFSPDGSLIALSVGRGQVELFDAITFGSLGKFETPELSSVSGIAFRSDSTQMAVCCDGLDIQLWNLRPIRRQLAAMKLDFHLPPPSPPTREWKPTKITVIAPPPTE